jgi:hypothetical protein
MPRRLSLAACALLLVLSACASQTQTAPSTRVLPAPGDVAETVIARANGPVTVDGDPSDAVWHAATPIEFIYPWADESGEPQQGTTARMLWDDEALYILYECVDPYLDAEVTEHDGPVYAEDAVEIFVTPDADDITAYFGYEMNIRGVFLDYMAFGGGQEWTENIHFEWESEGVDIATSWEGTLNDHTDRDEGWVLEVAIPWDNFRHLGGAVPPRPGDLWRLNLNRTAGHMGRFSLWSDTGTPWAAFHHSVRFGKAWFSHKPE